MLRHSACATFAFASLSLLAIPSFAQLPSNATLNGTYNVRYLGDNSDPSDSAVSFSGTIAFNGKGGFTVSGTGVRAAGTLTPISTGTYQVFSSGMLYMSNPFDPIASDETTLYGGVGANGVVFASSTDTVYCDMFIAIPQAGSASNATLSGTYNVASLEFLAGDFLNGNRDTFFPITANGSGSLGNVTVQGTAVTLNGTATTQTSNSATYSINANGSGTLTFPAPSGVSAGNTLISGTARVLAVSADGNLFIAGSATGYDMMIGLKAGATGNPQLSGIYFTGFLQNYDPTNPNNAFVYSGQGTGNEIGSVNTTSGAVSEIAHQRVNPDGYQNYDEVADDLFTFTNGTLNINSDPSYASFWATDPAGDMAIGVGQGNVNYELDFYLKAPKMTATSSTSVFLNPQGVVNAGSFSPFTAQIAPGEFVVMYGSGLAPDNETASAPLPTKLCNNSVQVTVSGVAAPIYYCTPTQIAVVVPNSVSAAADDTISFNVTNNGTTSNTVYGYLGNSAPGILTQQENGISDGSIVYAVSNSHATAGTAVTTANPAKAGDIVSIYMTGLGATSPAVAAGQPAPSTAPLAQVINPISITIGGVTACVVGSDNNCSFVGLGPTLANTYQVNVVIPSGIPAGDQTIEIQTSIVVDAQGDLSIDVDNQESTIPIG